MSRALILIGVLSVCLAACGYQLQGRSAALPGEVHHIYIDMFGNDSYEPFLENNVTREVVRRFSRHKQLEIVEQPSRAQALLTGRIVRYDNYALSYNRDDSIAEYRSQMTVEAQLRRFENGEVLWKGAVVWQEDYAVTSDKVVQDDREQAAIQVISQRLADELFSRMIDNF